MASSFCDVMREMLVGRNGQLPVCIATPSPLSDTREWDSDPGLLITPDSIRCSVRAFGYPEVKFGKVLPAAQQPTPTELVFRKAKFLRSNVPP